MSIDSLFRAEIEKWIDEDPDSQTQQLLQNLLDTNDEAELRSC